MLNIKAGLAQRWTGSAFFVGWQGKSFLHWVLKKINFYLE